MHPFTRRLIQRTPRRLRPAVTLVVRTIDDSFRDRVPGLAAEIAFWVVLSLPPLIVTMIAAIGALGDTLGATWRDDLASAVIDAASTVFSDRSIDAVIRPTIDELVREAGAGVLSIGFVVTLYSSSRALRVLVTAITIAYDLEATRPGWQQRLWALVLTLGGLVVGLVVVPVLIAGPGFGEQIAEWVGTDPGLSATWRTLYWPAAILVATAGLTALYHLAAPWWTPWHRDVPGAVLAMLLWLGGTAGLRLYAERTFGGESYTPLAGPLVLLLWVYVSGFAALLGAELNAEIERLWPTTEQRAEHDAKERRRDGPEHEPAGG